MLITKVFRYVCQVLAFPEPPDLFIRQDMRGGLQLEFALEKQQVIPFCVVGADLLAGRSEIELAFIIARELIWLRPEYRIQKCMPSIGELEGLWFGAVKMVNPGQRIPPERVAIADLMAQQLSRLVPAKTLEQLGGVVQKLYGQKKKSRDVVRWANSVERCAHRAGFIIVNDLEVAAACISCEPVPVGGVSVKEKIKQLVQYAVSERYFAVRSHLAAAGPH